VSDDVEFAARPGMTKDVLYARDGHLGRILLNRPRVINALTGDMVTSVLAQLQDWAQDDAVVAVSIQGAGDRGLCAGGDIRALRSVLIAGAGSAGARLAGARSANARSASAGSGSAGSGSAGSANAVQFWAHEYEMNAAIASYPKPFVAFMDGIVMGGGVGISAHGSLRLVTERSRVAMPETAIGYYPDVGSLFLLSRAPGEIGTHLAMTGLSVGGADAVGCGLADAVVDSRDIPALVARLAAGESLDSGVGSTSTVGALAAERDWVDSCYAGNDPVTIVKALRGHPAPGAQKAADVLQTRSPMAVAVALEAIRRAVRMGTLTQVLEQDLMLGSTFGGSADFVEGVRALLVDRDNSPRWRHRSLEDVDPAEVAGLFAGGRHTALATAGGGQRRPRPAEKAAAPPRDEDVE
jgi:enoyl-CoA hydratase